MYATNLTDQLFSAALPLKPLVAWCGSAESVTVAVPPAAALAGLKIGSVGVTLSLPDGSNVAAQAVHVTNTPLWTATFPASNFATSGTVAQGLMVTLAGEDENGVVRTWIVAKGDLEVRPGDASPSPGGSWVAVKLRDVAPDDPVEGDAYVADGELHIYAGGEWVVIGGGHDAAKLDGAAAYPAWEAGPYGENSIVSHNGKLWKCLLATTVEPPSEDWEEVTLQSLLAAKQDALSSAQLAAVNSGATAAKVATWDGYAAQIAQKASFADLPYALVTPGEWEFSGLPSGAENLSVSWDVDHWVLDLEVDSQPLAIFASGSENDLSVLFEDMGYSITATRPSLPGHLLDRANNLIDAQTGNVTLTLPPFAKGKVRDLLVHVNLGDDGTNPYTITVNFPTGESGTGFKVKGNASAPLPAPDAAGEWLYSFSECAPHKMAVSLAQLQDTTVAGGS